ncbi:MULTISPECIES: FtsW/RodA/SpoVE family cell cycle protein [Bacillaceae]|uniref:FtsW/RodA/SpoVE family cell cycle protein n=1 Tax=Metabacillus endolithicus TaxID=1535204 RepID=A0ABW5BZL0_9BACI|nr:MULTISPECIES: FtsW/RodA/SpoVE family cell cycle protein [Bacillaceae]PGT80683.1 rod shape-determining protein RodA [Bacillus sp. AFS040349]UGB31823.1 FtsW/RodA/SpoVE family cell cycle protein [Metabacillus sp. B2-18]
MTNEKSPQQQIDYTLIFIMFLLAIVSSFAINSAESTLPETLKGINFSMKQIQWYIIGAFAVVVTMLIDYDRFKQLAWYLYGFGLLLLLGLEVLPQGIVQTIKGATSWYRIGPLGNFQPSELMKIIIIIVLSKIITDHREKYPKNTLADDFLLIGKIAAAAAPPVLLLIRQPDMGMTMVFCAIIGSLILISGIQWRIIVTAASTFLIGAGTFIFIFIKYPDFFLKYILRGEEYQLDRFYGWLNPWEYSGEQGFQLVKSLLAIGSGELRGKGYQNLEVYLPEAHTDFIFAIISEQFGFIGGSIVVSLFFLLIYRMIHISLESNDPFGSFLCTGVIGMITFQVFQNVGMTIGLLPITGLPLPFVSYGGSSLATYMVAIGIVLNVRSRTRKYMFD